MRFFTGYSRTRAGRNLLREVRERLRNLFLSWRSLFSRVCERSVALLQGAYVSRDYEFELAEEFTDIREMKFGVLCNSKEMNILWR